MIIRIALLLAGIVFGWLICYVRFTSYYMNGEFCIDASNLERDIYRMELDHVIEPNKKYILLRVNRNKKLQSASETGFLMKEV